MGIKWRKENITIILEQNGEEWWSNSNSEEIINLSKYHDIEFYINGEEYNCVTNNFSVSEANEIYVMASSGEKINVFKISGSDITVTDASSNSGYECVERLATLTEESVTTEDEEGVGSASLSYNQWINADSIVVTFNNTQYTCEKQIIEGNYIGYGGFAEIGSENDYPFAIMSENDYPFAIMSELVEGTIGSNILLTKTPGTYQIKIEALKETVETTPCFEKAVKSIANILTVNFNVTADTAIYEGDKTVTEVKEVLESGGLVLFVIPPKGLLSTRVDIVNFITGNQQIQVQHEDNNTPDYSIDGEDIKAYFD